MNPNRRAVVLLGIVSAAAGGSVLVEHWHLVRKHYRPTPYDDVLALLADRDVAKIVGGAFLAEHSDFMAKDAAKALRVHLSKHEFPSLLAEEIRKGELSVAGGWIMPATLLGICALAASI